MTQPTNAKIDREIGELQGDMRAVKESLERIETLVTKIDDRLRLLEDKENQRKGAIALAMLLAGMVGAVMSKLLNWGA